MKNIALFRLLHPLQPEEFDQLLIFSQSPLFNKNKKRIALLEILKKHHPHFDSPKLDEAHLMKQLYPSGKESTAPVRRLRKETIPLVKAFLSFLEYSKDKHLQQLLLFQPFLKNGLQKEFEENYNGIKNVEPDHLPQKMEMDYRKIRIGDYQKNYLEKFRPDQSNKKQELDELVQNIHSTIHHLDHFYILQKLKYCCYALHMNTVYPESEAAIFLLPEMVIQLEENTVLLNSPEIAIYFTLVKLYLLLPKKDYVQQLHLQNLLEQHEDIFPFDELKDLYNLVGNYILQLIIVAGDQHAQQNRYKELFDWYKTMDKKELLLEGHYIPHQRFKNFVGCACRVKEFDWADQFIEKNIKWVDPDFQEAVQTYNKGNILFYKGQLEEAIQHFLKGKNVNNFYYYDINAFLMRIYFEQEEYQKVIDHADLMKRKLKKDRSITEDHKEGYGNFAKYIHRTSKIRSNPNSNSSMLQEVRQEIATTAPLHNQKWLLEKLGPEKKTPPIP